MKNRKLLFCIALAVIFGILVLFAVQAGERGVGIYRSETYSGLYDRPDNADCRLLATAQPGEKIVVTHVSNRGWATVEHPEAGTAYTNFFGLTPEKVAHPIRTERFYDGNEALPMCGQGLLWAIFLVAGLLVWAVVAERKEPARISAVALVAAEIAYVLIQCIFGLPGDLLLGSAFGSAFGTVIGFLTNMLGLFVLGMGHILLLRMIYSAMRNPQVPARDKIAGWTIMTAIVLFSLYIAYWLLSMIVILIVLAIAFYIGMKIWDFVTEFDRTHIELTRNPVTGKWYSGQHEYVVDEVRGTARKKKLFEL